MTSQSSTDTTNQKMLNELFDQNLADEDLGIDILKASTQEIQSRTRMLDNDIKVPTREVVNRTDK
jgi:hypothetical protein